MIFNSVTHFDVVLEFGGDAHCLPICVGRSRNLVGVRRAMVPGEPQTSVSSVSSKLLRVYVVD